MKNQITRNTSNLYTKYCCVSRQAPSSLFVILHCFAQINMPQTLPHYYPRICLCHSEMCFFSSSGSLGKYISRKAHIRIRVFYVGLIYISFFVSSGPDRNWHARCNWSANELLALHELKMLVYIVCLSIDANACCQFYRLCSYYNRKKFFNSTHVVCRLCHFGHVIVPFFSPAFP